MRIRTFLRRSLFFILLILATLLFFSCSGDKSTDVVEDGPDRTPGNLMASFARSYKEKDLDAYDECLCEDFRFHFTEDVADSLGLPWDDPWWGKAEDLSSTGTMFASPNVTDISFSFEYVGEWFPCTEVRGDTTYNGLCRRMDPLIEVTTIVESEDPILKLRVDSSWLDIMIVPDPHFEDLWCILSIKEVRKQLLHGPIIGGSTATERSSWGAIKSFWR